MVLEVQHERFVANREDRLQFYEYQFALYKDEEFLGMYESFEDAAKAGVKHPGSQPFLVKQVRKGIQEVVLVSQLAGVRRTPID